MIYKLNAVKAAQLGLVPRNSVLGTTNAVDTKDNVTKDIVHILTQANIPVEEAQLETQCHVCGGGKGDGIAWCHSGCVQHPNCD